MPKDDIRTGLLELLNQYQERCGTNLKGAIRDLVAEVAAISQEGGIDPDEVVQQGLSLFDEKSEESAEMKEE